MSIQSPGVFSGGADAQPGFLKRGLVTPFRRDGKADFANAVGAELVRSNVRQILGTKGPGASGVGEVPWLTEFGSSLHTLRHQRSNPILEQIAQVLVLEAIETWEPRARVTDVAITSVDRHLTIGVTFDVVAPSGTGHQLVAESITEEIVI